jgi:hypothetical protein
MPLLVLVVLAVVLATTPAHAQAMSGSDPVMSRVMEEYFAAEKTQAAVFLGVGLAGIGTSAYLFTTGDPLARGASVPVLVISLFEVVAGTGVLLRTSAQVADLRLQLERDPAGFRAAEQERMEGVMTRFTFVQVTELALIAAGLGLFTYGKLSRRKAFEGVGVGLAASTSVLFGLEVMAADRGSRYLSALNAFEPVVTSDGVGFRFGGRF